MSPYLTFVVLLSIVAGIKAEDCMCGEWYGYHCGTRCNNKTTNILNGDCEELYTYHCPAAFIKPSVVNYCSYCREAENIGEDYCPLFKAEEKPCTCSMIVGTHCWSRYNDGYMTGDCKINGMYHCSAGGATANYMGMCSQCRHGEKPGTDYCPLLKKDKTLRFSSGKGKNFH